MLPILTQIETGRLVCPRTHQRLVVTGELLVRADGGLSYDFAGGVPWLLAEAAQHQAYLAEQGQAMQVEYSSALPRGWLRRTVDRQLAGAGGHRAGPAAAAFDAVVAGQPPEALCVSIGGGPRRVHANLVNLNLDRFANVDVVGDAYALPLADGAVDAIHCEAVLEHLEHPRRAVAEMFRVLRPGGEVFAATPFLQAFHAYPNHFQNFTLEGHNRLFERAGFELVAAGACVGPTFMLADLASLYLRTFVPGHAASRGLSKLFRLAALPFLRLDRRLLRSPHAHELASTVFARLRKG